MGPHDNPGKVRGSQFGLRRVKGFGASGGFDSLSNMVPQALSLGFRV